MPESWSFILAFLGASLVFSVWKSAGVMWAYWYCVQKECTFLSSWLTEISLVHTVASAVCCGRACSAKTDWQRWPFSPAATREKRKPLDWSFEDISILGCILIPRIFVCYVAASLEILLHVKSLTISLVFAALTKYKNVSARVIFFWQGWKQLMIHAPGGQRCSVSYGAGRGSKFSSLGGERLPTCSHAWRARLYVAKYTGWRGHTKHSHEREQHQ